MQSSLTTIASDNLSMAWAKVMLALAAPGVRKISPLLVSIGGFSADGAAAESVEVREKLDELLVRQGKRDTENVAFTIFPQSYWLMAAGNRGDFFELYRDAFLRIQDYAPQRNKRGSYFQRLVDFEGTGEGYNQLKAILDEYAQRPRTRPSKWQATTFDPLRDLSPDAQRNPQLEFPCLQQISILVDDDGLTLNAFYASQQILRKAYGNYLGLSQLAAFMAGEMQSHLRRVNIFVGVAQLDNDIGKTDTHVQALLEIARNQLDASGGGESAITTAPATSSV